VERWALRAVPHWIGGNAGLGAAVGAGAGLLGGYLYDQSEKGNIDF
jgi:hypothetical protein